jgi:hypothetical protein
LCAVVNIPLIIDKRNISSPIIDFFGPGGIGLIARISSVPGSKLKETTIACRVFVVVSIAEAEYLPPQPSPASCGVPARNLII